MAVLTIREAHEVKDLEAVLLVEQAAFHEDHNVIRLVQDSLQDPTARPFLSLLAFQDDEPAGRILFTTAHLDRDPNLSVALLAPIAVIPKFQRQGIGGQLIAKGVELLKESGVGLIFVTGHPSYYPRHGFRPASEFGFVPPYPMPAEHPDAWMVRELCPGAIHKYSGHFICAKSIDKPEYWEDE